VPDDAGAGHAVAGAAAGGVPSGPSGPSAPPRFAATKFRPAGLPATLVSRPLLADRLSAGAGQRLTAVVGSAGAGKSVLLASWMAARPAGASFWLSCDEADARPVRFWSAFIEMVRRRLPWFGADAAELMAMDGTVSADVTASIANDAAELPAGTVIIVDDFQHATAAAGTMTDLVARWPSHTAQLVLASRLDPPVRLHRLRMSGELCELRDRDLYFSLAEGHDLLANFGVEIAGADLDLLLRRSEGWAAALQMAALSLRSAAGPDRAARALDVRSHAIAEYFAAEVLDQQPALTAQFLLDTSVLDELTAGACTAITGRADAAVLLRDIGAANLFLVPLDDEWSSFRYHHLVRQILRAELRARDPAREQEVHLRAGDWYAEAGDTRRAARHFLAARQADRALSLLQGRLVTEFLSDPALPAPLDLSGVDPRVLAAAPERLLTLAADLLLSGDPERGGGYLDLLERGWESAPPGPALAARAAALRAVRHGLYGRLDEALAEAGKARAAQEEAQEAAGEAAGEQAQSPAAWITGLPVLLMHIHASLGDLAAVEREADTALAEPGLAEPVKLTVVPGARALARFEAGDLAGAAADARAAQANAGPLGFAGHFFAVDYLRALAGLALEQRDIDEAERLTEQALSISERGRPAYEFAALLDRAAIWATRGWTREALGTVATARELLAGTGSTLLPLADELEARLRLTLGDLPAASGLADELAARFGLTPGDLAAGRQAFLRARIALAGGDQQAARRHLELAGRGPLTPRNALVRELLLTTAAIERGDPLAVGSLLSALDTARHGGYLNTVVTTAPQLTSYLIEQSPQLKPGPYHERLIRAAVEARAAVPDAAPPGGGTAGPLTEAELRVLNLLPTSTYLQIAAALCVSRNTVKTHLRSVYQKLGVASRSAAVERAVALRLL
jgi:LuxR family maltose regulon positive regulatory protein